MAASAPPPQVAARWVDSQRSDDAGTNSLEVKMSGMSLMSKFSGAPSMLNSSVSTASADEIASRQLGEGPDLSGFKGSTPSSPLKDPAAAGYETRSLTRPPGLGGPIPSPARNPGHSKTSSATSAMLTLTPNSSVDGNPEFYGVGRQQSPFEKNDSAPPVPFLNNSNGAHSIERDDAGEYPPGISNFGSFDMAENDGLLGLDALRGRTQSSPGPMARSFESAHSLQGGHLPPHRNDSHSDSEHSANRSFLSDRRPRTVSRDSSLRTAPRPPLSGGSVAQSPRDAANTADFSLGGLVSSYHSTHRNDVDLDFGVISRPMSELHELDPSNRRRSIAGTESHVLSRPDYVPNDNEGHGYNPSRRRSIGTDSASEYYNVYHNQNMVGSEHGQQHFPDQMVGNKFGSMPSLSHHLHQQQQQEQHFRMRNSNPVQHNQGQYSNHLMEQSRHSRSFSQPGPNRHIVHDHSQSHDGSSMSRYPSGMENDGSSYAPREAPRYGHGPPVRSYSGGEPSKPAGLGRRSVSMSHAPMVGMKAYDGVGMPKRNSQPNLNDGYFSQPGMPSSLHRMDKPIDRQYNAGVPRRHIHEDDLAGEHIEVPADHLRDDPYASPSLPGTGNFLVGDSLPLMRSTSEGMYSHYSGFEGSHLLPTAGAGLPSPKVVYNVKFKRTQRSFVLGPRINRDLKIGTYVKVEADRGEDLGIVVGKMPAEKYNFSGRPNFRAGGMGEMAGPGGLASPGAADLKCIIRLATHDEVSLLSMKREEEEELLKICRSKVRQRGLPMNVVDAEYQFDRHKLTFFFEAEGRIDFRELVRDLFSMYKTRIWMQQLDKNMTSANGTGQMPPPTNMIDYGTPIIAPASEFSDTFTMNSMTGATN